MCELTEEEIKEIVRSWQPKYYEAEPYWWVTAYKDIAKAAQAKLQSYYASLTPGKLREEVAIQLHLMVVSFAKQHGRESPEGLWPGLRETAKAHYRELAAQILSPINGYYASLTPEKLGDELFQIVDSANFKDGPTSEEALTQILSLVMAYFVEKIEGIENPYHRTAVAAYGKESYNVYPEFAIYQEAIQAVLKVIKEVKG